MKFSFKAVAGALAAISMALLITACEPPTGGPPTPGGTTAKLTSLTLSPTTVSMVVGGVSVDTKVILVTGHYDDDTTGTITDATWTSSAEGVATVSLGTITAVAVGTTTITATSGEKSATVEVTVTSASITNDHSLVLASGTPDLTYAGDPWDSGSTITWDDTTDTTYGHKIVATSGTGWGVPATATAFTGLTAGNLKNYEHLNFKVKSSTYTAVRVSFPGATTPEIEYTFASGTQLPGDWIQMSIPLADFGTIPITLTQFGILNKVSAGGYALTDVGFTGSVAVDASSLTAAITSAQTLLDAHAVGASNSGGEVTSAVHNAFAAVIASATTDPRSTWEQVAASLNALAAAKTTFIGYLTPGALATSPALASSAVVNVYTADGTYTNPTIDFAPNWGIGGVTYMTADTTSVATKTLWKFIFSASTDFTVSDVGLTIGTKKILHISVFTPDGGTPLPVKIDLASGHALVVAPTGVITQGQWSDLEYDFSAYDTTSIDVIVFANPTTPGTYWIDNLYFH